MATSEIHDVSKVVNQKVLIIPSLTNHSPLSPNASDESVYEKSNSDNESNKSEGNKSLKRGYKGKTTRLKREIKIVENYSEVEEQTLKNDLINSKKSCKKIFKFFNKKLLKFYFILFLSEKLYTFMAIFKRFIAK
jgi:hypothetical protein